MSPRRFASAVLGLAAGSVLLCLPTGAGAAAASTPASVPQYIVHFDAIVAPPSTKGLAFHSTRCDIGPATNPLVVKCHETGTIKFTTGGGSGTATVSSALAGIDWKFTLHRTSASSTTYQMTGKGTESSGASPVARPVKVTGTITVTPTPDPTFHGTEDVFPTSAG